MGISLVRKILDRHAVWGTARAGQALGIRVDQILLDDLAAPWALIAFRSTAIATSRGQCLIAIDRRVSRISAAEARAHADLRADAKRIGAFFSPAGNGAGTLVHLAGLALPGRVLLATDRLAPVAGSLGM
ncbi:MAG: hypothetical protein KGR26_12060, partial [Cyanobacteria bacterium REEB65]|nr:hypothetical protein [Cyanobacteria bacterium REEB65]